MAPAVDSNAEHLEVRELGDDDAPALRGLFEQIFAKPMSEAFWHWKYRDHTTHSIGAFRDGELQAHYGAVVLDACYFGKPERVVQIVDVMVSPVARQGVRNKSFFFRTCTHFVDRYVGHGRRYLFGFGFPSDRAMNLAARLQVYAPVGQMHEVTWNVEVNRYRSGWLSKVTVITDENFSKWKDRIEALWQAQAMDLQQHVVIRKDADWIRWRYLQNPDCRYRLLLLGHCFSSRPTGLLVLKEEAERMLMMDCIGPLEKIPSLVQLALATTVAAGKLKLATWISATFARYFQVLDGKSGRLPIIIPANIWSEGPKPEELQDHWWLMPGDTDFL